MSRNLLTAARRFWRILRQRPDAPSVLTNVFNRDLSRVRRRAVVSYLVRPFLVDSDDHPELRLHSQGWQNRAIARILDERGYVVDVVHHSDDRFVPAQPCDLLVGMGRACLRIAKGLGHPSLKIYINTGAESTFNNRQELERIAAVRQRRNRQLKPRRLTRMDPREFAHFTALACFGNDYTASQFRPHHDRVFAFNNCGVPGLVFCPKDYDLARRGFVYLSSHGQVHKGLDLLLEAFAGLPECTLYVCTSLRRELDFVRCYWRELFCRPNIRFMGWVTVGGEKFNRLCRSANSSVCASCAEGQVGSVVDCMHAGLLPIVSRECGIDTGDFGLTLPACTIAELRAAIRQTAAMPPTWHAEQSRKTRTAAEAQFSQDAFIRRWNQILDELLGEAGVH